MEHNPSKILLFQRVTGTPKASGCPIEAFLAPEAPRLVESSRQEATELENRAGFGATRHLESVLRFLQFSGTRLERTSGVV